MAPPAGGAYHAQMETETEIATRWRYLRDLLITQLNRFESGSLKLHSADEDVSAGVVARLKKDIIDFDTLIARSEARTAKKP